jgi:hypothetical protein
MSAISAIGGVGPWLVGLMLGLLVFGLAPRLVLRLIVRIFPKEDLRRRELVAELHAVPRWERPFWVAEQLEVAVMEGIPARIKWRRKRKAIASWAAFAALTAAGSLNQGGLRRIPRGRWRFRYDDEARAELIQDVLAELLENRILIALRLPRSKVRMIAVRLVDDAMATSRGQERTATARISLDGIEFSTETRSPFRGWYGFGAVFIKTRAFNGDGDRSVQISLHIEPRLRGPRESL